MNDELFKWLKSKSESMWVLWWKLSMAKVGWVNRARSVGWWEDEKPLYVSWSEVRSKVSALSGQKCDLRIFQSALRGSRSHLWPDRADLWPDRTDFWPGHVDGQVCYLKVIFLSGNFAQSCFKALWKVWCEKMIGRPDLGGTKSCAPGHLKCSAARNQLIRWWECVIYYWLVCQLIQVTQVLVLIC